ncbi:hypothetical protein [Bacillus cereus]|uniref:Uncharacterized protein n=1 Tax=Bacillus cereus TaxID=1396 RepID=A0ABD4LLT1_BACCE|nr:hypothetical protein [Bacillus cereus]MBK1611749.1 hypothetical protein [Bacillus cereus]
MNKTELKQKITELVELIYNNLHKLEYSSKHSLKAKEFLNRESLKQLHKIAYTKAYKGLRRDSLAESLKVAEKFLEYTEASIKGVHTYEAHGVEFVEHEDCVGICSVSPNANWQNAMIEIAHSFDKEIVFMVRETNNDEVALMKRWKMPVEDANVEGYFKCRMPVEWQMDVGYSKSMG